MKKGFGRRLGLQNSFLGFSSSSAFTATYLPHPLQACPVSWPSDHSGPVLAALRSADCSTSSAAPASRALRVSARRSRDAWIAAGPSEGRTRPTINTVSRTTDVSPYQRWHRQIVMLLHGQVATSPLLKAGSHLAWIPLGGCL